MLASQRVLLTNSRTEKVTTAKLVRVEGSEEGAFQLPLNLSVQSQLLASIGAALESKLAKPAGWRMGQPS
jgi:hypothetical protein